MSSQENDQSRSRQFFDVSGIDWDDETSIDQWARDVWTLVTNEWGNYMPDTPSTVLTDE